MLRAGREKLVGGGWGERGKRRRVAQSGGRPSCAGAEGRFLQLPDLPRLATLAECRQADGPGVGEVQLQPRCCWPAASCWAQGWHAGCRLPGAEAWAALASSACFAWLPFPAASSWFQRRAARSSQRAHSGHSPVSASTTRLGVPWQL